VQRQKWGATVLAVFLVCVFVGVNYATLDINKKITGMLAVAGGSSSGSWPVS
jgi:hypothetical protein